MRRNIIFTGPCNINACGNYIEGFSSFLGEGEKNPTLACALRRGQGGDGSSSLMSKIPY